MEQEEDPEIQEAVRKGEELYKLLSSRKVNVDAVFNLILNTNNFERQVMQSYTDSNYQKSIIGLLDNKFPGSLKDILISTSTSKKGV